MINPNKGLKMKREEGRQHGLIQTFPASARLPDSPPATAVMFHNKVSRKSRRCNCCHDNPVCSKPKDKAKGTHNKMKKGSGGVGSDLRLVSKRVVDSRPGLHYSGFSDDVGKKEEDEEGGVDENGQMGDPVDKYRLISDPDIGSEYVKDDDDDKISFYDVGFVWDEVDDEDEGWCLVG